VCGTVSAAGPNKSVKELLNISNAASQFINATAK
jgi:hypothetical protein